jgi:hypothetical protein
MNEEKEGTITRTCKEKDCRKPFTMSVKEAEWLKNKGLEPYKRCPECRMKRKLEHLKEKTNGISGQENANG